MWMLAHADKELLVKLTLVIQATNSTSKISFSAMCESRLTQVSRKIESSYYSSRTQGLFKEFKYDRCLLSFVHVTDTWTYSAKYYRPGQEVGVVLT